MAKGADSFAAGDYRWVAEVLSHVVFAEPDHEAGRALLADTFEQLGYGAENGTWRCAYLSAAHELRHGSFGTPASANAPDLYAQLTPEQWFDVIAIRVDGPRAWDLHLTIDIDLTDVHEVHRLTLNNGVLSHSARQLSTTPDLTLRLPMQILLGLLTGHVEIDGLEAVGAELDGESSVLAALLGVLDRTDPDFEIVTP